MYITFIVVVIVAVVIVVIIIVVVIVVIIIGHLWSITQRQYGGGNDSLVFSHADEHADSSIADLQC